MTDLYTRSAATATKLLAQYGMPVQIKRTSAGTFDPVTGTTTG